MKRVFLFAVSAALLATGVIPAAAHLGNISYAEFVVRNSAVLMQFKYAAHLTPGMPMRTENPTRAELLAHEDDIRHWLDDTTTVDAGHGRCPLTLENIVGPDKNQDLEVIATWTCQGGAIRGVRIEFHPLAKLVDDWQTIASLKLGGSTYSTVFSESAMRWQVGEYVRAPAKPDAAEESPAIDDDHDGSAFGRFFRLGVWHIWTGYDHLLFLLAVLLAGGGLARIAAIVTSFTIAHSITLGAAATGLVQLPSAPVEAAIALSIIFVALENVFERGADRRALVTFFFGLIHGFGFAGILAETALPPGEVVVPLLAFNLGVEAGQLVVVLAVVPLLSRALRSAHGRRVKVTLSLMIAAAGAMWAIERVAAIVQ